MIQYKFISNFRLFSFNFSFTSHTHTNMANETMYDETWATKFFSIETFLNATIPSLLLITSIVSNIFIILVYSRKRFQKVHTRNIWRLLSLVDIFCCLQIIKHLSYNLFGIKLYTFSIYTCKFITYFSYFSSISAWLHVYLTCERFFSILFPSFNTLIRRKQVCITALIFASNILFYSQRFFLSGIVTKQNETYCGNMLDSSLKIFMWIDLLNSALIPFILMFLCSMYLTVYVLDQRKRIQKNTQSTMEMKNRKLKRDIKFSLTLIFLNFAFIALNLPINIYFIVDSDSYIWYSILDDLYYSCYAVNFFIYFSFNSIFREEFLIMMRLKNYQSIPVNI